MTDEAEITHQGLCTVDGCPFPDDEGEWHTPWCQAIKGHRCFGEATHQHWPKKGMGGHNPESKIVACLCAGMHDAVDNGVKYGNAVIVDGEGRKVYRLWEVTIEPPGKTLIERVIGEGGGVEAAMAVAGVKAVATVDTQANPRKPSIVSVTLPVFPRGVTPNLMGLQFDDLVTYEEWAAIGPKLALLGDWLPWAVGDWLKHGQWAYGEKYSQAASDTGLKEERLMQYQWVAENVETNTRVMFSALHWTHFREVAALPGPQQAEWLQRAQDEGLTTRQLHDCVTVHRDPPSGCQHEWVCKLCGAEK